MSTEAVRARRGDLVFSAAVGSSIGRRYPANFDVCHLGVSAEGVPLVVVADGMGAGRGSELAGRTAVDTFVACVAGSRVVDAAGLRGAVAEAQRRVRAAGAGLGELTGCTLTALVGDAADPSAGWIVQIGDSRAYRLRSGLLEVLTVDHTVAWIGAIYGWYRADSPAAEAARYHLTRYIGHPDEPEPDVLNVALRPGDVWCVCTDGIAEQVPYQRLAERLGSGAVPGDIVDALLADALAAGGRDNATVAVLRITR